MGEAASGVQVARGSIERRLEKNGGDSVFLVFKVAGTGKRSPADAPSIELMAATKAAVDRANEVLPNDVWAADPMYSVAGPVINLDWIGTDEQNDTWLSVFATTLEERGFTGTVTAAAQARIPEWLDDSLAPSITCFIGYRTAQSPPLARHRHERPIQFGVEPSVTQAICEHAVSWGGFAAADVYLRQALAQIKVTNPDVAKLLADGLDRDWMAGVRYVRNQPETARSVEFSLWGEVCYQIVEPGKHWSTRFDDILSALLRDPQALDLGFIRYRQGTTNSWLDLDSVRPRLPGADATGFRLCRQLWDQYVPDAHAVQVLTSSHLDNATSLADWNVKTVAPGRHLVQARDLAPWFEGPLVPYGKMQAREPEPAVLAAARDDFGAMIMTQDIADANMGR